MFLQKAELSAAGALVFDSVEPQCLSTASFPIAGELPGPSTKLNLHDVTLKTLIKKTRTTDLSLAKRLEPSSGTFMAEMMDCTSGAANFDWNSNPAASDGEIIACEMIRKMCGLNEKYSWGAGGVELFLPHLNEALLLSYHSTTYKRGKEAGPSLVTYGVNDTLKMKPFLFRGCAHVRPTPFSDEFKTVPDITKLRKIILEDKNNGLLPHFLICTITELNSILRLTEIYQMLAAEFDLNLFVDLSPLGMQVLVENSCSLIDSDFVFVDMSEASHLSSGVFYLRDKATYEKNIVNPPQEYLMQPKSTLKKLMSGVETKKKFDAYDFTIGFSNYVSWQKFLFFAIAKGKNGIRQALERQKQNLDLISKIAARSNLVEGVKVQENHVVARLKVDPSLIEREYLKSHHSLPFEIVDKNTSNLVRLYAPLLSALESDAVSSLFESLGNITSN